MYLSFFGFREKPFNLTPDPKFLYLNASYREALAALHYGIAERKGFVTLIGEAGTGKTTLLRRLLSELGPETRSVLVLNPSVSFDDLLTFILTDLGRPPAAGTPKLEMLEQLNAELLDTLARGGNVVVLIDEAQDLGIGVLEELRLLSNLETAKEKILQFVLAGQPELDAMLERRELRQLRQRIAVFARLRPLARREVEAYVAARIHAAGGQAADLFSRPALFRLWRFSGGVPRLVNVAGDNALVTAYAAGRRTVGWRAVGEAVADLRPSRSAGMKPYRMRTAAITVAVVLGIALGVAWSRLDGQRPVTTASAERNPVREPAAADPAAPAVGKPAPADVAPAAAPAPDVAGQGMGHAEAGAPDRPHVAVEAPSAGAGAAVVDATERAAQDAGSVGAADHAADAGAARGPIAAAPATEPNPSEASRSAGGMALANAPTTAAAADRSASERPVAPPAPVAAPAAGDNPNPATASDALVPVRIEHGDTLSHIVRRYFGKESPTLIAAVRRVNPWIADPDVVLPGQTVLIPGITAKANGEPERAAVRAPSAGRAPTRKRKRARHERPAEGSPPPSADTSPPRSDDSLPPLDDTENPLPTER